MLYPESKIYLDSTTFFRLLYQGKVGLPCMLSTAATSVPFGTIQMIKSRYNPA